MSQTLDSLHAPRVRARITAILIVVVALSVFLFSFVTLVSFDRSVAPELQNRTRLIATVVRDNIQQTLSTGLPLNAVGGFETYIAATMDAFSELENITIVSRKGEVIASVGREEEARLLDRLQIGTRLGTSGAEISMPILVGNDLAGHIKVKSSGRFVEARLRSVLLDATALAIAVILIGVELTILIATHSIWGPLRAVVRLARDQGEGRFDQVIPTAGLPTLRLLARRLNDHCIALAGRAGRGDGGATPRRLVLPDLVDMRIALFSFAAATEVTASFLPVYAKGASRPDWLDPAIAAALPSALYLLVLALLSPLAARVVARYGPRRVFALSAIPAALALLGMTWSDDLAGVVLSRGIIAVCYAFATVACQDYALALRSKDGARVSSVIMAMVFGGTFCGSTIGGVFADRYGYEAAMVLGAILVLMAGLFGYRFLVAATERPAARSKSTGMAPRTSSFYMFLFGIVAPLNLVTAISIWYLAPLHLSAFGASPAQVARVVMLFYLAQLILGPVSARIASHPLGLFASIIVGGTLAGLSLALLGGESFWQMTGTVIGVGAGFGLVRGPALELAARLSGGTARGLSAYRVTERGVALVGLLVTAFAMKDTGVDQVLGTLSAIIFAGLAVFCISIWRDSILRRGGTNEDPAIR